MPEKLDTPPPIQITEGSLPEQMATAGRYLLAAAGSYALGRGWISDETLQFITTVVTIVAPLGYAMWKTYSNKRKLVTVGAAAPNSVAQVVQK